MAKKYYAVKKGIKPGVYSTWDQCKAQVSGFSGALFKSFATLEEAELFVRDQTSEKTALADADENRCDIYVDGSYLNKAYGWGFAVYRGGKLLYTACGKGEDDAAAKTRNIAGELEATMQAVKWAKSQNIRPVAIHHDYIGISEWAENRWKTNNEITRSYAAYMQEHLNWIHFVKVSGHTGVEGNELADQLAKKALGAASQKKDSAS